MKNLLVARTLEELANYTELEEDQPYRARAYRKASQIIESLSEPIENIDERNELKELPGVGENIEKKVQEIIRTGKLEALEKIKRRIPVDVSSLSRVEGIGPKTIKLLYDELRIKNLEDLESAAKSGRLREVKGLGVKSEETIIERIENAKKNVSRIILAQAMELSKRIVEHLKEIPDVRRFEIAGSFRRRKETIGDFDVLIEASNPEKVMSAFTKQQGVREVLAAGESKASVKIENNFQVDARVVAEESFGAALLYFTGSKSHNVKLRTLAIKKGMRLNEYGLSKHDESMVAGKSEKEIYEALGMGYIEPEMREDRGEIEAAMDHKLPELIELRDVRGDLQMHTKWSDGRAEIEEMAERALKMGYEYIAITDHVGSLAVANPMDEKRISGQRKEIDSLNEKYEEAGINFHVLQGAEVNIKSDARLDMPDSSLKKLDIVLAAIHGGFSEDSQKITKRIISAMENDYVDVIAHPTGRLLLERSGYSFDFRRVVEKALETGTLLEMDAHANRLDLNDENAREAIKVGLKLSIDTDSHEPGEMEYMTLGLWQARRAWARKGDILNTKSYKDLVRFLCKN